MTRAEKCPAAVDLERAFWSIGPLAPRHTEQPDPSLLAIAEHILDCASCEQQWDAIGVLADAGRRIEVAPALPGRREELRTKLVSSVQPSAPARTPVLASWRRWFAIPIASAAAAGLLVWWLVPGHPRTPTTAETAPAPANARRGTELAHPGARYLVASASPDEILRLVDGTISVRVDALPPGERFRVMTLDAEIEAAGAALDVTAAGDRLASVRVIHGNVEIRAQTGAARTLRAGETWRAEHEPAPAVDPPVAPVPVPVVVTRPPIVRDEVPAPVADTPPAAPPGDAAVATPVRSAIHVAFDEAWVALRSGDYPRAAAAFERASFAGGNAGLMEDATFWGAVALARGGEIERAVKKLEIFLDGYPSSVRAGEASVMLGWLHFQRGDQGLAARRFESAQRDASPRIRASAELGLKAIANRRPAP